MTYKYVGFNWGLAGILVIGGRERSVEFWSAANLIPEQGSCVLEDYPRGLGGPTVNLVSGRLVTCQENACDIYLDGTWQHLQNTATNRSYHTSASTKDALLLIGGKYSNSTEWIPMNGSLAQPGPFTVRHGIHHCTIQVSVDVIVVTGGIGTDYHVTQYQLVNGQHTFLPSMGQPRSNHACGVYKDSGGQQVRLTYHWR